MAENYQIEQYVAIFEADTELTAALLEDGITLIDAEREQLAVLLIDNNTYLAANTVTDLVSENYLKRIDKTVIEYHMADTQPDLLTNLKNTLKNNSFQVKTRHLFPDIGFLFALKK